MQMQESDCLVCGGKLYIDYYTFHLEQSIADPCPQCMGGPAPPESKWADVDKDGWLEFEDFDLIRADAYWDPGPLAGELEFIVLHRLGRGVWGSGPRYIQAPFEWVASGKMSENKRKRWNKAGRRTRKHKGLTQFLVPRYVGWHLTFHKPGWERLGTQHAPLDRMQWNAGHRLVNKLSVGCEYDAGPKGLKEPYHQDTINYSIGCFNLIKAIPKKRPPVLIYHSAICPETRRDPGPRYPGEEVSDATGLSLITDYKAFRKYLAERKS